MNPKAGFGPGKVTMLVLVAVVIGLMASNGKCDGSKERICAPGLGTAGCPTPTP